MKTEILYLYNNYNNIVSTCTYVNKYCIYLVFKISMYIN